MKAIYSISDSCPNNFISFTMSHQFHKNKIEKWLIDLNWITSVIQATYFDYSSCRLTTIRIAHILLNNIDDIINNSLEHFNCVVKVYVFLNFLFSLSCNLKWRKNRNKDKLKGIIRLIVHLFVDISLDISHNIIAFA